eukprot:1684845-Prorocentrum_lima.AAC.1
MSINGMKTFNPWQGSSKQLSALPGSSRSSFSKSAGLSRCHPWCSGDRSTLASCWFAASGRPSPEHG